MAGRLQFVLDLDTSPATQFSQLDSSSLTVESNSVWVKISKRNCGRQLAGLPWVGSQPGPRHSAWLCQVQGPHCSVVTHSCALHRMLTKPESVSGLRKASSIKIAVGRGELPLLLLQCGQSPFHASPGETLLKPQIQTKAPPPSQSEGWDPKRRELRTWKTISAPSVSVFLFRGARLDYELEVILQRT